MARKSRVAAKVVPLKIHKCPNCGKPAVPAHRPFCSDRCADADLGRWLNEEYRIPTNETPGDPTGGTIADDDGAPGGDR